MDTLTEEAVKRARKAIIEGKTATRVKTDKLRGFAKVRGGEGTADKSILLLSTACRWGIANKFVKNNPAENIKTPASGVRETVVKDAKGYGSLFAALEKMEAEKRIRPAAADAIRLIAMTGARRGEVAGLRWRFVNLESGLITLPLKKHKAGKKTGEPRIIALPAEATAIIRRQPTGLPEDYVFRPKNRHSKSGISLHENFATARAEAKLPAALGMHGLRHSIGSHLAMAGASQVELMKTLGISKSGPRCGTFTSRSKRVARSRSAQPQPRLRDWPSRRRKTVRQLEHGREEA